MSEAAPNTRMVLALAPPVYDFLGELISRAVGSGLIAPDELPAAARVWEGYRSAAPVVPPPPADNPDTSEGDANDHA